MEIFTKKIMLGITYGMMALSFFSVPVTEAASPIKMGVITAWDFIGGHGAKRGAEMAIRQINANGGLLDSEVVGVFYDNKGDPGESKNATERLLYRDKVDVICGYWRSDLAIACQPLVMEAKKILLLAGSAAPILTKGRIKENYEKYKYTFSANSNSLLTLRGIEESVIQSMEMGLSKIALLVEKAAWCDPIYEYFKKQYAKEIVYSTRFSTAATDFSVEFSQVKASGAEILAVLSTGRGGTPSVKQWYDMKIPALYVGYPEAAQDPNFWKTTEGKCNGVAVSHIGGLLGKPITDKSIPYYDEYKKVYGEYPVAYTNGLVYDVVMAYAHGVKMAGTTESDAVVKAMEKKDFNYVGVCGILERYNEIHNPTGGGWKENEPWGWVCTQWQNGKREIYWPDGHKTKNMIIPERIRKALGK